MGKEDTPLKSENIVPWILTVALAAGAIGLAIWLFYFFFFFFLPIWGAVLLGVPVGIGGFAFWFSVNKGKPVLDTVVPALINLFLLWLILLPVQRAKQKGAEATATATAKAKATSIRPLPPRHR